MCGEATKFSQLTTTEKLRLEAHVVEGVNGLVVVGLDLTCAEIVSK